MEAKEELEAKEPQQVENLVVDEDQENMKATNKDEENENHKEGNRKSSGPEWCLIWELVARTPEPHRTQRKKGEGTSSEMRE